LALAHSTNIKKFTVNTWLKDGDLIYLDDKNQTKEQSLEVLITPGHTPDSIALFSYVEHRMFIGDTFYPFTAVHLDCIGSNLNEYIDTLKKMLNFIKKIKLEHKFPEIKSSDDKPIIGTNAGSNQVSQKRKVESVHSELVDSFLNLLSLDRNSLSFDPEQLLGLCNYSMEEAVNFYLSSPEDVKALCPAQETEKPSQSSINPDSLSTSFPIHKDIMISCGHVEANLSWQNIQQLLDIMDVIVAGALPPVVLDGEYGEFSAESFTLLISMKQLKQMQEKKV